MEVVMTTNAPDTATGLSGPLTSEGSVLDRRRNKLQVAKSYAASAVSDLRRLDESLASNALTTYVHRVMPRGVGPSVVGVRCGPERVPGVARRGRQGGGR